MMHSMNALTLQLSDTLAREIEEVGRLTNRAPEVVAQDMLQRMVALRRFETVRQDVLRVIDPKDAMTEQEIFERIS